jgi:hypothetical protein
MLPEPPLTCNQVAVTLKAEVKLILSGSSGPSSLVFLCGSPFFFGLLSARALFHLLQNR